MPLTGMNTEQIAQLETELLAGVPVDGRPVGNGHLRDDILDWENDRYWAVRQRLVDSGILVTGRGRGGSVRRPIGQTQDGEEETNTEEPAEDERYPNEESLYDPMTYVIANHWARDQPFDNHVVENTDRGGRRRDGIWSRPDITVAAMTSYTYVPGRHFDVITFEIKHFRGLNVTAVYEAMSHRRAATRSYVLAYIPDEQLEQFEDSTLADAVDEANRHGVGLIVASDPANYDTWDIREEATLVTPDPARLNSFIRNQLTEGTRDQIVRWFRV